MLNGQVRFPSARLVVPSNTMYLSATAGVTVPNIRNIDISLISRKVRLHVRGSFPTGLHFLGSLTVVQPFCPQLSVV